MILLSYGIITPPPDPKHIRRGILVGYDHWQLTAFGLAFSCAGISLILDKWRMHKPRFNNRRFFAFVLFFSMTAGISFFSVMIWFFVSGTSSLAFKFIGMIILGVGLFGVIASLTSSIRGIPFQIELTDDPIQQAEVYIRYFNIDAAQSILNNALITHPQRAAEIQNLLNKITVR